MDKIWVYVSHAYSNGDCVGTAIDEDGNVLARHLSSNEEWLKNDMGVTSSSKHKSYEKHFPNGYELRYVTLDELLSGSNVEFITLVEKLNSRNEDITMEDTQ